MEEGFRRTNIKLFIVELGDKAMNRIFNLYKKIKSKSNALA